MNLLLFQDAQPRLSLDFPSSVLSGTAEPETTSPSRNSAYRSVSFRERREVADPSERLPLKRKSSVDFDALKQVCLKYIL